MIWKFLLSHFSLKKKQKLFFVHMSCNPTLVKSCDFLIEYSTALSSYGENYQYLSFLVFSAWSLHFWKLFPFVGQQRNFLAGLEEGQGVCLDQGRTLSLFPDESQSWHWVTSGRKNRSLFGVGVCSLMGWRCLLCVLDLFVCVVLASGKEKF